jgi:hypothetical protein
MLSLYLIHKNNKRTTKEKTKRKTIRKENKTNKKNIVTDCTIIFIIKGMQSISNLI